MTAPSYEPGRAGGSLLTDHARPGDPPVWHTDTADPVGRGPAPTGVVTLADLADSTFTLDRLTGLLGDGDANARQAAVTSIHYALMVVHRVVIEPLAQDRLIVTVEPTQAGFTLEPHRREISYWVGEATVRSSSDGAAAGARAGDLLWPVIRSVRRRARVGSAGLELIVLDSLTRRVERLDRAAPPGWGTAFLAATGLRSDVARRTIPVATDAGPPVELPLPRVCCVLSPRLAPGACPTCPNRASDDARREAAADWLGHLDDEQFEEIAGRRRITVHG